MTGSSKPTVVSLFSGLGGLDLGFLWAGFEVIWACDVNPVAVSSYNLNFKDKAIVGDLTALPNTELPKSDVIIGGPPCQSFSLVGRRDPDDPRGLLVFRFFEIIKAKRPKAFIMENVPGMGASSIDGVRLPEFLSNLFQEIGYKTRLLKLNALDYLVPQRRKRLILIGFLDHNVIKPDPFQFARECYGINLTHYDNSSKAAIGDLGPCVSRDERSHYNSKEPSKFAKLMRQKSADSVSLHEKPKMSETDSVLVKHIPPGGNYKDVPDDVATGRILKFKQSGGRTTTYGRLHPERAAYTINTYFRRPNVGCNFHYEEPRLITRREAMRFQSIPDHFEIADAAQDTRNALIGNAVPPLMAHSIAWSMLKSLSNRKQAFEKPSQMDLFDNMGKNQIS